MARSSGRARKVQPTGSVIIPLGMEPVEFRLQRIEDEAEKRQRLRKDFLSFLVKDPLTYAIAILLIIVAAAYCVWALWQPGLPREDRQWAMSVLTSILTAVVGFAFGKVSR
jgi:hypothetical protein